MSVVFEVAQLLNASGIKYLKRAYPFSIPNSSLIKIKPDEVLLSVSEIRTSPITYGSDRNTEFDQEIQIKICYPTTNQVNMDTFENSIVSFLYKKQFNLLQNMGHYIDPAHHVEVDFNFRRRK
ncbi:MULTISPECIES: DUF806 family protein [Lactobacillus]|uniref:DUF806 family protein n=1 Tax=Lactobacillus xujianguonis TaxID=2495899 RepID=A0A437SXX6_9LACO|nr:MULTISPECIES: DUF806 family protein [Lactobacillus]RVU71782.1 DUF806 family protein [Lactobacillus xujianguonis]